MLADSPLDAWVSLATTFALQTLGYCYQPAPDDPERLRRHFPRLSAVAAYFESPWQALADIGLTISPAPTVWPILVDMSLGLPDFSGAVLNAPPVFHPLIAVDVFCPACSLSHRHLLDGTHMSLQASADEMRCTVCNSHIWPFPSFPRPSVVPVPINVLSFNQQKRTPENAKEKRPPQTL